MLRRYRRVAFLRLRKISTAALDHEKNRRDVRQNQVRALRRVIRRHLLQNTRIAFNWIRHVCNTHRHHERHTQALRNQRTQTAKAQNERLLRHVIGRGVDRCNRQNMRIALCQLRRHADVENQRWRRVRLLRRVVYKKTTRLRTMAMIRWREVVRENHTHTKMQQSHRKRCEKVLSRVVRRAVQRGQRSALKWWRCQAKERTQRILVCVCACACVCVCVCVVILIDK